MKKKIIVIVLIVVLILAAVGTAIYFLKPSTSIKESIDWQKAYKVNKRATEAQYLPNKDLLLNNVATLSYNGNLISDDTMSEEEYNELIDEIGAIWHPYNGDFNITDVKEMVMYLSHNIGVFDKFYRFRGHNGYEDPNAPDSVSDGNFYMTIDESGKIRVIQSMGFQPVVYDSELDKNISNETDGEEGPSNVNPSYKANWPIMMNEVLVVEYYFEEIDGEQVEVVECQIVQFLHVYNTTYVARYQGLKNVKNRSFTRYEINCMTGNLDFRNANQDGLEATFMQIDYSNSRNISILSYNTNNTSFNFSFEGLSYGTKITDNDSSDYGQGTTAIDFEEYTYTSLYNLGLTFISEENVNQFKNNGNKTTGALLTFVNSIKTTIINNSYALKNYDGVGLDIFNADFPDITDLVANSSDWEKDKEEYFKEEEAENI